VIVLIPVAHCAAVKNHRVIEERAVAVGRRGKLLYEVREHLDVVLVDQREIIHVGFHVGVM